MFAYDHDGCTEETDRHHIVADSEKQGFVKSEDRDGVFLPARLSIIRESTFCSTRASDRREWKLDRHTPQLSKVCKACLYVRIQLLTVSLLTD